ncbi:MAG TPA: hypothetical protein DCY15_05430 [Ruminococcaceae bacterium]|nr:hypothetical protein [Oscillospiraceae bacterium]
MSFTTAPTLRYPTGAPTLNCIFCQTFK